MRRIISQFSHNLISVLDRCSTSKHSVLTTENWIEWECWQVFLCWCCSMVHLPPTLCMKKRSLNREQRGIFDSCCILFYSCHWLNLVDGSQLKNGLISPDTTHTDWFLRALELLNYTVNRFYKMSKFKFSSTPPAKSWLSAGIHYYKRSNSVLIMDCVLVPHIST